MQVVQPSATLVAATPNALILIEQAGRTCYQSAEDKAMGPIPFIKKIIERGHESVLEHASATFRIVCDRGITHEIVRHRIASYSQESTRYCNYANDKFGSEIKVIRPPGLFGEDYDAWEYVCKLAENTYLAMIARKIKPEIARSILPNCLKTEIVMTCNFREWRHFFRLRTSAKAHVQMRELANMMLVTMYSEYPVVFDDIFNNTEDAANGQA